MYRLLFKWKSTWTQKGAQMQNVHSQTPRHSQKDYKIFQLTHSLSIKSLPLAKLIWGVVLCFPFSSLLFFLLRGSISSILQPEAVTHFISRKLARSIVSIPSLYRSSSSTPCPKSTSSSTEIFLHQTLSLSTNLKLLPNSSPLTSQFLLKTNGIYLSASFFSQTLTDCT